MSNCRFVDPTEFVQLVTSWRKLERRDVAACELAGVFDPTTNEWFVVEEEKLAEVLSARLGDVN